MSNDTIKTRTGLEARYRLFDSFALQDQKNYYERSISRNRQSGGAVNRYRALFSFLAGLSAASAGLLAQMLLVDSATCGVDAVNPPGYCTLVDAGSITLAIFAIVFPAVGTIFSTLSDLFQWDKLTGIYTTALNNLEVADAMSPSNLIPEDELDMYRASVNAFATGTINVMRDETSQWGQSVRTPKQVEEFVARQREKAESTLKGGGDEEE